MKKSLIAGIATIGLAGAMAAAPASSLAQGWYHHSDRGTWNALALGSAALGVYGIASHQPGLAFLGAVGTGYSLYRASAPYYGGYYYGYYPRRVYVYHPRVWVPARPVYVIHRWHRRRRWF